MVETKLFIPRLRRNVVERPRLGVRLAGGWDARLTLISAPAGFGKTTLITAWLAARDAETRSVAWLSLDEGDREPGTFWTYLITALQKVVPGIGAGVLPLLESAQPPIETAVAAVLNELSAVPNDVFLVLDDYHLVDGSGIRDGMVFLLEHLPSHIHLVISGRADPLLPLARLRARGELVEIRSADLRFTPDEVATYLNDAIGLGLTPNDVAALEGRTEGWIAALQLAVLSMQGRTDIAGFIAGFAGDDRHVVDYLVEEVLQRQTEQVRTFLLRTCLLERLTGPLCDAVTGERGGRATLEALDRANLFLAPLDDSRHWYRYHALFADMLQAHLLDERPDEVTDLHRRASRWYEENGQPVSAVRHALAAGDVEQAANLIERALPALQRDRQESVIRAWLDAIPDEVVRARPVLAVGMIGALMSRNEFDGVAERLDDVEIRLQRFGSEAGEPGSTTHVMIGHEAELDRLPAGIQLYRAALALIGGDLSAALEHARLSTDLAAADDHIVRAAAAGISGLALWAGGDLEAAHRAYSACAEGLQRAGHIPDVLGCAVALADIRMTQGRLGDALQTLEQALLLASRQDGAVLRGMPDMYVGMSQIACERGDLELATEHLSHSNEFGEHMGLPQNPYRWRVATARVREAQGDLSGALALVDEAQRVYVSDFFPDVRPVAALRARLLAARGDVGQALGWAREHGVTTDDTPTYIREFEHITLARILLIQCGNERDDALLQQVAVLLDRLQSAADAGGRTGSTVEILALQALRRQAAGDTAGALAPLERALTLAEPEGYMRVFVGAGPPMVSLLAAIIQQRPGWEYVRRILSVADQDSATPSGTPPGVTGTRRQPGLVDRLSERELDVLRLLATDLDGPHIARRLIVSLNTVRTHTKSIYTKLGVNSRRAAVRRAAELGLLAGTHDH